MCISNVTTYSISSVLGVCSYALKNVANPFKILQVTNSTLGATLNQNMSKT